MRFVILSSPLDRRLAGNLIQKLLAPHLLGQRGRRTQDALTKQGKEEVWNIIDSYLTSGQDGEAE